MGAWATAQDIDDNDKRFSESYVARQESKVMMLADARCELFETSIQASWTSSSTIRTICTIWEGRA